MTEPKDSQTSISQEKESKDFVNALKQYLYGFDLNPVDERRIGSLFLKYADRIAKIKVKKVYVTRYEKVPVYIDLRTNVEINRPSVAPDKIIEFVRWVTGIKDYDNNHTRKRSYTEARQFCAFLLKNFTSLSLTEIGSRFKSKRHKVGFQEHTTVIHNVRQGKYLILNIPPYAKYFTQFKNEYNVGLEIDSNASIEELQTKAGSIIDYIEQVAKQNSNDADHTTGHQQGTLADARISGIAV